MKKITAFVLLMMFVVVMMAGTVWANEHNPHNYRSDYREWYQWYMNWINYYYNNGQVQPQLENSDVNPQSERAPKQVQVATTERTDNSQLTVQEEAMIVKVNQERIQRGLEPLKVEMRLVEVAREKARDLIVNNYFDHQSPTLGSPFDQIKRAGIQYRYAGENLAGSPNVDRAHTGLMNSPGHRANILKPRYTHIGVGVVEGGPYGTMWVQMFIEKY